MEDTRPCPCCKKLTEICHRHPKYICRECVNTYPILNKDGEEVVFSNIDWTGGFVSRVKNSTVCQEDHICYINGIKCWADEYRFGGIVIEAI